MREMPFGSKYYGKTDPVSILPLSDYDFDAAREVLRLSLERISAAELIKPGAVVIIKANLVSAMKPETGATTHPVLISALTELLYEMGAGKVIIGDSPGGLYNSAHLNKVYDATGLRACVEHGAELNFDFGEGEAHFPDAAVCHTFAYTTYLDKADLIVNFCKLKSHGMMGMSCAAKNLFGTIPGVIKPEYHYRFPSYTDFSDMLLDLDEYFHPMINIADAVVGMEGNGPTAGTPKQMGVILASRSPHTLDMVAAKLIGFAPSEIPTLDAAARRGLIPDSVEEINLIGNLSELLVTDFERVVERRSLGFWGSSKNPVKNFLGKIVSKILETRPALNKSMCVGCGVCRNICPAKAIVIKDGKAEIDRKKCIRCFCCQEFCPKSAMVVKRTFIAQLFHREKKK